MPSAIDELSALHNEFLLAAQEAGIEVCPIVPEGSPDVSWPDESPKACLALAVAVKVPMLYVGVGIHDSAEFSDTTDVMGDDASAIAAELRAHDGKLRDLTVMFSCDGIRHLWRRAADWWEPLEDRLVEAICEWDEHRQAELRENAQSNVREWAESLAQHPEFRRTPLPQRAGVCRRVCPDVTRDLRDQVVDMAQEIVDSTVAPLVRADRAAGMAKSAIWAKHGITSSTGERYLQEGE